MSAGNELDINAFLERGWCRFAFDPVLKAWVDHARPAARRAVSASDNSQWLRCDGTWFVGVNVLPNSEDGALAGGPVLAGAAVAFVRDLPGVGRIRWDRGQVSVCYPGYPGRTPSESDAAHRYRIQRDAAHVDGLLAEGSDRRRYLRETHAFILGVPLFQTAPGASPFVVWEGSHEIVRASFVDAFGGLDPGTWRDVDITDTYHAVRRRIFETCPRLEVAAQPGEAYLVHRLALHGMAPWRAVGTAAPHGRMICYFRPETAAVSDWLALP